MEKQIDCLFDNGKNCLILKRKECEKCKFFKENTPANKTKYIDNINEEIRRYAKEHI